MAFIKHILRSAIWKLVICFLGCKKNPYFYDVDINGVIYSIKIEQFFSMTEHMDEYLKILKQDEHEQLNKAPERQGN